MAEVEELRVVIRTTAETQGATQTATALRQVRQEAQQHEKAAQAAARSQTAFGNSFLGGSKSALEFGLAVGGVSSAIGIAHQALTSLIGTFNTGLTVAIDFGREMAGIGAVSGATAAQLARLSELARTSGQDIGVGAVEGARGLSELVKGGVSTEAAMNGALRSTQLLAKAGGVDLATAAEISATALNSFGLSAFELARVANLVAGAANASSIGVDDFRQSLSQVGAVARTAGISFDDTAVAIAELGQAGLKGSDAGTSLRTFLLSLQPTSQQARDELRKLGIITADGGNRFFDAAGKAKSFSEITQILKTSLTGYTDQQRLASLQIVFGTDALRAAAIFARGGAAGFDTLAASMTKISASEVASKRMDSLGGDLDILKAKAEATAIALEQAANPPLRAGVQTTTATLQAAQNFAESAVGQITGIVLAAPLLIPFTLVPAVGFTKDFIEGKLRPPPPRTGSTDSSGAPLNAEAELRQTVTEQIIAEQQALERLPGPIRLVDEATRSADQSLSRFSAELAQLTTRQSSGNAIFQTLVDSGDLVSASIIGAENSVRQLEIIQTQAQEARLRGIGRMRELAVIESQVSDPRDANAKTQQAARDRIRILDELQAKERAVLEARRAQNEIQDAATQARGAEAQAVLDILPQRQEIARLEFEIANQVDRQTQLRLAQARLLAQQRAAPANEALEDTNFTIQRDQALLRVRGTPLEERQRARREVRDLQRNVLPQQELDALDANRDVTLTQRRERANDLANEIRQNPLKAQIEALRASTVSGERVALELRFVGERLDLMGQVGAAITAAVEKERKIAITLGGSVTVNGAAGGLDPNTASQIAESVRNGVYAELTEAAAQAQLPPAVQQSGVRR